MTELDLTGIIETAKQAAADAAEVLRKHYMAPAISLKSSTQDLVTQADIEAEEAIMRTIRRRFPEHDCLREEGESTGDSESEHLWIIDPLDGTTNYAHGIPQFCTAIAYASRGDVKAGVVLDPMRDEMFHAIRGRGACLNNSPIHVSSREQLNEAVIGTGFYYDRGTMMKRTLAAIEALFTRNVRGIRRCGGAALDQCWVACGRFDAFFEYQLSPWDYAAASLVVQEAGGISADRTGAPPRIDSNSLIVSNSALYEEVLEIVRWRETSE